MDHQSPNTKHQTPNTKHQTRNTKHQTPLPVAILAGGLATRLGQLTRRVPKSLVPVAGRPFVDHQLALLARKGVRQVVFCVGHFGEQIEAYVGDGRQHGLEVRYSHDGPRLLGTAGALRRALPLLGEAFWVLYGDSYLDVDFQAILDHFHGSGALGLMTVLHNDDRWDRSNVTFQAGRLVCYSKRSPRPDMTYVDYGLSILRSAALEALPAEQVCDLADVYSELVAAGRMIGHEVQQRFYEIGSTTGLAETETYLRNQPWEPRTMSYTDQFLAEAAGVLAGLDRKAIDRLVDLLVKLRERGGRLFILGVGGSAANASHAVNDFRKITRIEAYAPTDNVSELTARTNDDGWETVFVNWLRVSKLCRQDMILVLSVGGGNLEKNVSPNLVRALEYAREVGCAIGGIVGRCGGHTARVADACVVVPTVNEQTITPHAEAFQGIVWHLLVSHPALKQAQTHWETVAARAG